MSFLQNWDNDNSAEDNDPVGIDPEKEDRYGSKDTEDDLDIGQSSNIPVEQRFKDYPDNSRGCGSDHDGFDFHLNGRDIDESQAENDE